MSGFNSETGAISTPRRLFSIAVLLLILDGALALAYFAHMGRLSIYARNGLSHIGSVENATQRWRNANIECTEDKSRELQGVAALNQSPWGTGVYYGCFQGRFVASYSVYQPICSLFVDVAKRHGYEVLIDGAAPDRRKPLCTTAGSVAVLLRPTSRVP